jgi:hypothetical protein
VTTPMGGGGYLDQIGGGGWLLPAKISEEKGRCGQGKEISTYMKCESMGRGGGGLA